MIFNAMLTFCDHLSLLSRCDTNDCNTMDPRSSAGALVSTLTLIVAAVAVINF